MNNHQKVYKLYGIRPGQLELMLQTNKKYTFEEILIRLTTLIENRRKLISINSYKDSTFLVQEYYETHKVRTKAIIYVNIDHLIVEFPFSLTEHRMVPIYH